MNRPSVRRATLESDYPITAARGAEPARVGMSANFEADICKHGRHLEGGLFFPYEPSRKLDRRIAVDFAFEYEPNLGISTTGCGLL